MNGVSHGTLPFERGNGGDAVGVSLVFACWQRCLRHLLWPHQTEIVVELWKKYIETRYREPQRYYHTLSHLAEMLGYLECFQSEAPESHRLREEGSQRLAIELALLFHDAVYDPRRGDNEERSVDWFQAFWEEGRQLASTCCTATRTGTTVPMDGGDDHLLLWKDADAASGIETAVVEFILTTKNHMSVGPCYVHSVCSSDQAKAAEPLPPPPPPPDLHLFLDLDLAILGSDSARYKQYAADIRREYAWYSEAEFCRGRSVFLRGFLQHPQWYKTNFFCVMLEKRARENVQAEVAMLEGALTQTLS